MLPIAQYHILTVTEVKPESVLLDADGKPVALPAREAPSQVQTGMPISVFLYLNQDNELVATTKKARACAGDLAVLKVVDVKPHGAYLDWGIARDLFMPRSLHFDDVEPGDKCLVKVFLDESSGNVLAKENLDNEWSNEALTVKEKEPVEMLIYKDTPLGYQVIINNKHLGLMHHNEVFTEYFPGDKLTGFIKKIKEDNKLDVVPGKPGFLKATDEATRIIEMLKEHKGFLPYHDKSDANEIYKMFGISKKTFKMTIGTLYRQKKIKLVDGGIQLLP
jgi:predicted RNA-binding protein (virulence factor B family)